MEILKKQGLRDHVLPGVLPPPVKPEQVVSQLVGTFGHAVKLGCVPATDLSMAGSYSVIYAWVVTTQVETTCSSEKSQVSCRADGEAFQVIGQFVERSLGVFFGRFLLFWDADCRAVRAWNA
jgi:hypothetical protein